MKKIFNTKMFLISTLIIIIFIVIIYSLIILNKDTIYKGVTVNNIDISGYSRNEAVKILQDKYSNLINNKKIILTYENKNYYIKGTDIDLTYDYYYVINKAYEIGRNSNLFKRLIEINSCKISGKNIVMDFLYDEDKLFLEITKITNIIDIASKDAKIDHKNNKFIIIDERIGRKVDKDEFKKRIKNSSGVLYFLNNSSVTILTLLSVDWADNIVATNNSKGEV